MARETGLTTISPSKFAAYLETFAEDALAVTKMANWAEVHRPECHVSALVGTTNWTGVSAGSAQVTIDAGWSEVLRVWIYVNGEADTLVVGAECFWEAGEGGEVKFVLNGGAVDTTLAIDSGDNGTEITGTIETYGLTLGWMLATVEVRRTAGASVGTLINVRIEEQQHVLNVPANE